jgi:hypothetical protein
MAHKYNILEWNAENIYNFLKLPAINFAVFNFDRPFAQHYRLLVAGFDVHGDFIDTSSIEKYSGIDEPDLDNAYTEGLFFVMAADINTYSGNGTKTLYFEPESYIPTGGTKKYVYYNIYDAPPKDGSFDGNFIVGSINPSPPRNAGS